MSFLKIRDYYNNFSFTSFCKIGVLALGAGAIIAGGFASKYVIVSSADKQEQTELQETMTLMEKSESSFAGHEVVETDQNTVYVGNCNAKIVFNKTTIADILSQGNFELAYDDSYVSEIESIGSGNIYIYEDFNPTPYQFGVMFFQKPDIKTLDFSQVYVNSVYLSHEAVDHSYKFSYNGLNQDTSVDTFMAQYGESISSENKSDSGESYNVTLPDHVSMSFYDTYATDYSGEFYALAVSQIIYFNNYNGEIIDFD